MRRRVHAQSGETMKDISNAAGRYVSKLGGFFRRQMDAIAAENRMTPAQCRTLLYITGQNREIYQKDIEEEYGLRAATATQLLQGMEEAGLIRREVDEKDRRKKRIVVVEGKREVCRKMVAQISELETQMIENIEEEKLVVFFDVIEQMIANVPHSDR